MTSRVEFIDTASIGFSKLLDLGNDPEVQDFMGATYVNGIQNEADLKVHRQTGRYINSIHYIKIPGGVHLGDGVKYGASLEDGTRPHIIRAKNKKSLKWGNPAKFAKSVRHPGTRPYHIFRDGIKKTTPAVVDGIGKIIGRRWDND